MSGTYTVVRTLGRSDAAHDILEELPEWFGIDRFTHEYVEAADRFPNYLAVASPSVGADGGAVPADDVLGVLLLDQRYPTSAEVHLLAVRRKHHRAGIGRDLMARVEDDLRGQGVRLLSVKTLGPSAHDPAFDQTRAFYGACGFHPVEEFPDLWADDPCLLMVKPL
ncbi:GNAT family N-acetyltransferase [Promicromonospora sp. MEB111]|uniref:GNAT family N-acetyltransferase n=1 Tax=unclassified Promicromonospora TaxID=2647929 RepID=UPI00254D6012|nr:GNAT family N-acetyltransferase [Promicromonospora sp. MEB111]